MAFLDPASRVPTLERLRGALGPQGRLATGFGAGRGYSFTEYENDLVAAGLTVQAKYSTWDLRPFTSDSGFLVCVSGVAGLPLAGALE